MSTKSCPSCGAPCNIQRGAAESVCVQCGNFFTVRSKTSPDNAMKTEKKDIPPEKHKVILHKKVLLNTSTVLVILAILNAAVAFFAGIGLADKNFGWFLACVFYRAISTVSLLSLAQLMQLFVFMAVTLEEIRDRLDK